MTALDVVRAHYEAGRVGDLAGMLAPLDANIQWTEMAGSPYAGTFSGPDAVRDNVLARLAQDWSEFTCTMTELYEAGDTVIALGSYTANNKTTGKLLDARVAHVWQVSGDKAVRFEQFTDTMLFDQAAR